MNYLIKKIKEEYGDVSKKSVLKFLAKYKKRLHKKRYNQILNIVKEESFFKIGNIENDEFFDLEKELNKLDVDKYLFADNKLYIPNEIKKELKKDPILSYQKTAIEVIVDAFKNSLYKSRGPKYTFLFIGPPATGKTYIAKKLSEILDEYKLLVLNLGSYARADEAMMVLLGSDNRFNNSRSGELTRFVINNPKSIVVFDEFEKAPVAIQQALLAVYNDGKLRDKNGFVKKDEVFVDYQNNNNNDNIEDNNIYHEVDFSETIFIFTSNLGKTLYKDDKFWEIVKNDYKKAQNRIIDVLYKEKKIDIDSKQQVSAILPEFISRFQTGDVVLFRELDYNALLKVAKVYFNKYVDLFESEYKTVINVENNDLLINILLLNLGPKIDTRKIETKIGIELFDKITDYMLENKILPEEIELINITFEKDIEKYLNDKVFCLDNIIREIFRNNYELLFKINIEKKEDKLNVDFVEVKLKKVISIDDYDTLTFEIPKISFNDIAGHKKVKEKLKDIIALLKSKEKSIPKGMLLYGPPGTGKTMLAKALANEAKMPFISVNATELFDSNKIDKIFNTAADYAPSIIFIDEFDALSSRDESPNPIINLLLSKIDGFNTNSKIFIIAATNYIERVDQALLRSGRIDIKVEIDSLDKEARKFFIQKILDEFNLKDIDIENIVRFTSNMTGADLEKVKRELRIKKILGKIEKINEFTIIDQINEIKYGEVVKHKNIENILKRTAIHEAAHAVISKILIPDLKIEQITIVPRKKSLGFVSYEREKFYQNIDKEVLFNKICVALAGRLAEMKKFNSKGIDTGASNDIQQATLYAYQAIAVFGMDEEYFNIQIDKLNTLNQNINVLPLVKKWIDNATEKTKNLIDKYIDAIENVAQFLLENETISEEELEKLIQKDIR